ncbi:phosphoesterase, putative [hydrothermal vent metagenome]|uniref:Phosphoesterase, putative n=1 Tax=hydrothermal vent metagenome TaxID=652676 RepID=A0A1W1E6Q8_9ZZZZ
MKIGILSDSHAWIHPDIVNLMNTCDRIVHAGDIVKENTLEVFTAPLTAVRGNNDAHLKFADIETLQLPGGKLAIEHGHKHGWQTPSHDSLRKTHADVKAIVYGHTHKQIIDTKTSPWIINPGASGAVRNRGSSKCLILTIDDKQNWEIIAHNFANGV